MLGKQSTLDVEKYTQQYRGRHAQSTESTFRRILPNALVRSVDASTQRTALKAAEKVDKERRLHIVVSGVRGSPRKPTFNPFGYQTFLTSRREQHKVSPAMQRLTSLNATALQRFN